MWDSFAMQAAGASPGAAAGALIGGFLGWPECADPRWVDNKFVEICKNRLVEWITPPDPWEILFVYAFLGAGIGFVLGLIVDSMRQRLARD